jgi:hypothetical protein
MDIFYGTTEDLSYAGKPRLLLIAVKICGKAARAMIDFFGRRRRKNLNIITWC